MVTRQALVVDIAKDEKLTGPVRKGHRGGRSGNAYIIHDIATNSVILGDKLTAIATVINEQYARNCFEKVCPRGLYQAADSKSGYPHKMRFQVSRCDIAHAHIAFQQAREMGVVERSCLVTEVVID